MAGEIGPCEGCRHFDRCTANVICCEAFALFAKYGSDRWDNSARWSQAPRQPSAAILERLVCNAQR
jgi:hypothetical protein